MQAVFATIAVDKLAKRMMSNGDFDVEIFSSLCKDKALFDEILM